jgi:hypothetical protein
MRQTTIDNVSYIVLNSEEYSNLEKFKQGKCRRVEINVGNKPKYSYWITENNYNIQFLSHDMIELSRKLAFPIPIVKK